MTPRSLWIIILKIFGIYLVLQIYYPLVQLISSVFMAFNQPLDNNWLTISFLFFAISIYLFMIIAFLFRTDWLIGILKLDNSIKEEKLEINVHRSTVLKIVIMLAGIAMFADSLPLFLKELYSYYQQINDTVHFKNYPRASIIITELVKVLISYFMMTSSRLIVNFIERKRKETDKVENTSPPGNN
ncbi:hypothetical protein [Mucilaginibacter sp.]|uniref:hypothetical protein n=1 Tax=Mucilaginibacter sp. TaxID=1882438 RepID=UPI00284D6672|nr:hypothetical protein [Mucilaginibacter sp.]MDR3695772.1 hypothetical protein [Mucilaginibacter sp.]